MGFVDKIRKTRRSTENTICKNNFPIKEGKASGRVTPLFFFVFLFFAMSGYTMKCFLSVMLDREKREKKKKGCEVLAADGHQTLAVY
jgi:hypothetical protein